MKKLYVNPLPIRIWHWTNAAGFVLLMLTGLQIRYLDQVQLVSFKTAVVAHNWVGFVLIADYFLWLGFYLFTGTIKVYAPELSPAKYLRQLRYYGYGIFRGDHDPHQVSIDHKFNPLQGMTYLMVMAVIVPVQFFTGLLLWDIARFSSMVEMFGGVRIVDMVHVIFFIFLTGFFFLHPFLSSLSDTPWAHYKAMITGYEEVEDEAAPS
ncbi:Cytochrome B561 [Georgfuchsia toluolica]|uniref:Cytochrome B561 n=1 Tax=Georgfuchsia toluolica TaxID=424218 RepID=A0A916N0K3_9PROT|nr:cytochrome b/b6 domain-containing protein [Georgfuchsia toluolica]CAG4884018.1 Cytochrome B561 [Georgfuchsia toluolica]